MKAIRIGIVSNSDAMIPLVYTLVAQKLQVCIFFSPSEDNYINQKVSAFLDSSKIPATWEKHQQKDLYKWLNEGKFDVCFVLGYKYLIELNKQGQHYPPMYNIHFGPLPAFKGPSPVFWQLRSGMEKIGLAIHLLTPVWDDGPVVWIKEVPNESHYDMQMVSGIFSQICVEGVFHVLRFLIQQIPVPVINRSGTPPSYHKRPGLNDVLVDWENMKAEEICNLIRACNPWNRGAISFFKRQEVKLLDAIIVDYCNQLASPGTIVCDDGCVHVQCMDGNAININMLYFQEHFIPAYWGKNAGFLKNECFLGKN